MSIRDTISKSVRLFERDFITLNQVEISEGAILHNYDFLKSISGGAVFPVLKANAYGHGLTQVATILKKREFPYIAVDSYFEALRIRAVSPQNVLIMGAIVPENYKEMDLRGLALVVHDNETLESLGKLHKHIPIHLELETGMTRHGVQEKELEAFLTELKKYPKLQLEGIMSHLADADNPTNTFTKTQVERFDAGVEVIQAAGYTPRYFHIAQTAGSTKVQSKYANTVRAGIGLYGINPLPEEDSHYKDLKGLQPALQVVSTLTKILDIEAGQSVSYSRTFTADTPTLIGVLPIGYYECLPRALSNKGEVVWKEQTLPIVGNVNMNHCMINLGSSDAKVGDRVTVLGGNSHLPCSIQNTSQKHSLFAYSLLTGINENLRRVIVT